MKLNRSEIKQLISLIPHTIIFGSTLYVFLQQNNLPEYIRYFTNLSNILAGFASLLCIVFLICSLIRKENFVPKWCVLLQYAGACATALTSVTVILFLTPMNLEKHKDLLYFFRGEQFHTHFLNCLLSGLCCAFFNFPVIISEKNLIWGVMPSLVYACVYAPCVLSGKWKDFYGFTLGGKVWVAPIAFLVTNGVALLFALLYRRMHNKQINHFE